MKRTTLHAAAALALLAPVAALAQNFETVDAIPWPKLGRFPAYPAEPVRMPEIWAQVGVLRDNNLFRLADDAPRTVDAADEVARVGAGIRHEFLVTGRQRLRLEARGDQYAYRRHSFLNNFAYGLRGEWLWEFTNDLSGALGYERRRRIADLAQVQRPVLDQVIEDHAFARAAYRLGPSVRLRGALDWVKNSHSDDSLGAANSKAVSVLGGVDYVTPLGNAFGVEARQTQSNNPNREVVAGTAVDNEFTEREIAAVATIVAGPSITGAARLGRTQRTHEQFPERNFQGTTWRTTVLWTPLQKTGFELALYREPRSIVDLAASYVLVTGASFGPRWAPTQKLVFYAVVVRERQRYQGDPNQFVSGVEQQEEVVRSTRFGVGWEPVRSIELSAGIDHGTRESNRLLRDFTYTAVMANARYSF